MSFSPVPRQRGQDLELWVSENFRRIQQSIVAPRVQVSSLGNNGGDYPPPMLPPTTPPAHTHAWSAITSTPTTLAGYGITDALDTSATNQTKAGGLTALVVNAGTFSAVDAVSACNIYPFEILINDTNSNGDASIGANGHVLNGVNDAHVTLINATGNAQLVPDKLSFGAIYLDKTRLTDLTDAGDSALHYHATDRNRANHTGTQAWSTITGTPDTLAGYGITNGSTFLAGYNQTANQCAGALNSGSLQGWTKICSWATSIYSKKYIDFQMYRGGRGVTAFNVRLQYMQEGVDTVFSNSSLAVHQIDNTSDIAGTDFALFYNIDSGKVEFWFYDNTLANQQYVFKVIATNIPPTLYYGVSASKPTNINSERNATVYKAVTQENANLLTGGGNTSLHYHSADRARSAHTGKETVPASTITEAGLNLPHGVEPTVKVNGDKWTTTAGEFTRVNGVTYETAVKSFVGNLQLISLGNTAIGQNTTTNERGHLVRMINGTGATSVKGNLISASTTTDNQFVLQANEFDTFGVVAESGIASGQECWIWVNGSTCEVLWVNGQSSTRGYLALSASTDGRALNVAVPSSNPVQGEHFKECGHVLQSKTAGTNVLVLCQIHFN